MPPFSSVAPTKPTVAVALAALALLGGACSSAKPIEDAGMTANLTPAPLARKEFPLVLKEANKLLAGYAEAVQGPNSRRNENAAGQVGRYLRKLEAEYRVDFFSTARDADAPANQGIAVAVLGFSTAPEALSTILSAMGSDDDAVITNACMGLALLRHPNTPPGALAAVIDNPDRPVEARACAAWALFEVQSGSSTRKDEIAAIWERMLQQPPDHYDSMVLLSIVRGMGLTRDPDKAGLVEPLTEHPTPKIREAACIALGRLHNQKSWPPLLERLGASEINPNVRLAARKALQALAGDVDLEYDQEAWRRVFERG